MASLLIKPKKLKIGDTIGVFGSSSFIDPEMLEGAANAVRAKGFNVVIHEQCYRRDRGAAGTTQEKINALHDLFADPSIHAVFSGRGGARALHMLDGIDYDLIRSNPKIFMGYSDVTALHAAIYWRAGLITFHGQNINDFSPQRPQTTCAATLPFILGDWVTPLWHAENNVETLCDGDASGVLFGGNLALLYAVLASGAAYEPDWENIILVIEDIGEEIRSIDRMLGAMRLRGIFKKIRGLVVGKMTDLIDKSMFPFDRTVAEIVTEHTGDMKGPIVLNAPIGHEHPNVPFPIGIKVRVTAVTGQSPVLTLLESPFADG